MITVVSLAYVAVSLYFLLRMMRGRLTLNPAPLFVLQQLVFFLGTAALLDLNNRADNIHLYMCFGTLCTFILGNRLCEAVFPVAKTARSFFSSTVCRVETARGFNALIGLIIIVSIIVCVLYFRAIGYNLFLSSIMSIISGGGTLNDPATLRLHAYSPDSYFAPGYVNQFKNVLFPLLLLYLYARHILLHRRIDRVVVIALAPVCVVFLLGTGQRGPFFEACVTAVLFFLACLPRRPKRRIIAVISVTFLMLLLLSTFILGRTVSKVAGTEDVAGLGMEVVARFATVNEASDVLGFRYIYGQPLHYGSGEWIYAFKGLVPGHEERVSLANEIYELAYGTTRGTAPVSIWAAAWYEFGMCGALILAFMLGITYHAVYARLVRKKKTLSRLLVYACVTQILGMWVINGPDNLFNDGLLAVVVLMVLIKVSLRVSGSSAFAYVLCPVEKMAATPSRRKTRVRSRQKNFALDERL